MDFKVKRDAETFLDNSEDLPIAAMKSLLSVTILSYVTFAIATSLNGVTEHTMEEEQPIASSLSLRTDRDYSVHPAEHESASTKLAGRAPRFEDASGHSNVTVQLGGTAFLNCRVMDLQDKTVSWVRRHKEELHLLTVGMQTYSTDSRFSLHFQHPNDWRLQIKYARPHDEGIYECQITIHPPRIYTVRLIVVVPRVEMVDDHGRVIEEKIYKTGSTIELKCVVSKVPGPTANVMWRHGLRLLNYDTSRGGISVKTDLLPYGAVSRLYIANASQRDGGNYTCSISDSSWTTVVVHISKNGEHPAAMQHGQSSSYSERRPISMTVTLATVWLFMWKFTSR